jgi:outer membrane protein TolC
VKLKTLIGALLFSGLALGQTLTLEQFKTQARNQDPAWKAAHAADEAGKLLVSEADTITALQFTSQVSYLNDNRQTQNPAFQGDRTENLGFYFGLQQQTEYGVQWDLLQNFSHTKIYDVPVAFIPTPDYYSSYPKVDVSVSLWRNFMGAETAAQVNQVRQQAMTRKKQAELQMLQKEVDIENSFYEVHSLQQSLEAQKDGLARAEKVLDWTNSRIVRNLVDKSEIYQAQAAVTARKIEISTTKSNLAKAIEKFNSLRGSDGHQLSEKLIAPPVPVDRLELSNSQARVRKDIRLQEYVNQSNESNYRASREKYKPKLDLSMTGLQQGQDASQTTSISNMGPNGKDYFLVALTLTVPLDQKRESNHREGYDLFAKSQVFADKGRLNDERVAWENNVNTAQQLKEQITELSNLELQQKNKADAEREKFNRGRSTLFQVLTYEQDYLAARVQKIALELQVREFINQLNLFE